MTVTPLARKYAQGAADAHRRELGWLPSLAYEAAAAEGRIRLITENQEPCGFALVGAQRPNWRIFQIYVEDPQRLKYYAHALLAEMAEEAARTAVEQISCHCAIDLDSNHFWHAEGFIITGQRKRSTAFDRTANRWAILTPRGERIRELVNRELTAVKGREKILKAFGLTDQWAAATTSRFRRLMERRGDL